MVRGIMLAGVAVAALAAGAQAEEVRPMGWYVGLGGGVNWARTMAADPVVAGGPNHYRLEYDMGWGGAGTVGYRFDGIRFELEGAYKTNELQSVTRLGVPEVPPSGETSTLSAMLNAVIDLPMSESTDFYFGGGLGYALVNVEAASGRNLLDDSDGVFAFQALTGLNVWWTPQTAIFADYRYQGGWGLDLDTELAPPTARFDNHWGNHSIFVGVRYFFDAPAATPVDTVVDQPQPVEVREFVVYFDFDKANLTAEAQAVVAEAAAAIQAGQNVSVTVVGHTDTVGSAAYNQRLSERRANAVKKELVRLGVGEGAIATSGVGFSQPAVDTGPGVREPRNRRATINF